MIGRKFLGIPPFRSPQHSTNPNVVGPHNAFCNIAKIAHLQASRLTEAEHLIRPKGYTDYAKSLEKSIIALDSHNSNETKEVIRYLYSQINNLITNVGSAVAGSTRFSFKGLEGFQTFQRRVRWCF